MDTLIPMHVHNTYLASPILNRYWSPERNSMWKMSFCGLHRTLHRRKAARDIGLKNRELRSLRQCCGSRNCRATLLGNRGIDTDTCLFLGICLGAHRLPGMSLLLSHSAWTEHVFSREAAEPYLSKKLVLPWEEKDHETYLLDLPLHAGLLEENHMPIDEWTQGSGISAGIQWCSASRQPPTRSKSVVDFIAREHLDEDHAYATV